MATLSDVLTFSDIKVSSMKSSIDEAFVRVNVKRTTRPGIHNLMLKVDMGAQGNTLPLTTFRKMFPDKVDRDGFPQQEVANAARDIKLTAYNGTTIPCCGTWSFPCKRSTMWNLVFSHVDSVSYTHLTLPTIDDV